MQYGYIYQRGDHVDKDTGTNVRFTSDLTLPPVTLSGSHGYSTNADIYDTFGVKGGATRHTFELCTFGRDLLNAAVVHSESS